MVKFDGQRVGRTVMSLGGNGVGQVLVAVAAAFLVRHLSGPEPALPSECDIELEDGEKEDGDIEVGEEAPVSGKVTPVTIRWCNISCFLSDKSSKSVRWLLKNVSGEAKPGRLLAIMGPSGSGKTTLLNILAGQLAASPRLHLSGLIDFNGKTDSNKRAYRLAYVRQEDLFFSQLTVRETLKLAAELQLTEISSVEEREEYVNSLLLKLGLVNCAESCVGDARVRGISGGEKKRLSLACELIASPSVIFADEPTTGLDAFQAEKVVETLKQLAKDGHTVICSIHQPRGSVYSKFDDIVLLTEGALVYAGPAHEEPLEYFSKFGLYNCPDHVNPAEFLADLISIDYSSADSVYSSQKRIYGLVESFSRYSSTILYAIPIEKRQVLAGKKSRKSKLLKKGGWWRQFCLLLKRAWMQASRDGPTNKVRARMSIASAIIFGSVFWRMGRSQTSIQDRMGLLQVAAINTAMAALTKTVGVFPKERAIVDRERAKGSYTLGPYLLSKLLAEIPIGAAFPLIFGAILYPMARLHPTVSRFGKFCSIVTVESFAASAMGLTVGAMVPSTEAAMAVGPSLMTVFIVFGGYYVNADNTPIIFRWIPSVSLIRWAFQGLCVNEFKGLQFDCQHSFDIQTGEQALERLSFGQSRIGGTLMAQSRILLFWYYTAYLLLEKNKPKYQQLEPPPLDETQPDDLQIETFDNDNLHKTEREGDLQIETFDNDNLHKTEHEGDLQIETFDHENLHKTEREGDLQIGTFDNDNLDKSQPERELQMKTFDNDNLDKSQPEGDLQMKTFDNDNLDKSQPEGDLQMKTFDNDNLDKSQPEGDLQMKTFDNENLNKTQLEGDLQIESFDNDNMEKPPSLEQVESKDADIETPEIDQIRPFILEGAK